MGWPSLWSGGQLCWGSVPRGETHSDGSSDCEQVVQGASLALAPQTPERNFINYGIEYFRLYFHHTSLTGIQFISNDQMCFQFQLGTAKSQYKIQI